MRPEDLITDAQIGMVHAHANFGTQNKRTVVDRSLLKVAAGYHIGHTAHCILLEHGLIRITPKRRVKRLTKLGKQYLYAVYEKYNK